VDAKQTADVEVFACLRHHTFIGRNDEREQIDAVSPGEHVFDEAFVTGNVYETELEIVKLEIREPEIDRDPASLLFRKTIRISTCESAYESAFPVINMAGRADDE
jgi:hypothetical protein